MNALPGHVPLKGNGGLMGHNSRAIIQRRSPRVHGQIRASAQPRSVLSGAAEHYGRSRLYSPLRLGTSIARDTVAWPAAPPVSV
jgi:hypothetical protein